MIKLEEWPFWVSLSSIKMRLLISAEEVKRSRLSRIASSHEGSNSNSILLQLVSHETQSVNKINTQKYDHYSVYYVNQQGLWPNCALCAIFLMDAGRELPLLMDAGRELPLIMNAGRELPLKSKHPDRI